MSLHTQQVLQAETRAISAVKLPLENSALYVWYMQHMGWLLLEQSQAPD